MSRPINWSPGVTIAEIERQVILAAYDFYRRNKTVTATALGIAIRTLDQRLAKYKEDESSLKSRDAERAEFARAELHRRRFGGPALPTAEEEKAKSNVG